MLAVQDVGFVQSVHLLEEDEGEDGVGAEAGVVRREALPQGEEALRTHHAQQHLLVDGVRRTTGQLWNLSFQDRNKSEPSVPTPTSTDVVRAKTRPQTVT